MNTFLGIDPSTTGLKVTLLTESGALVGSAYCEYPILVAKDSVKSKLTGEMVTDYAETTGTSNSRFGRRQHSSRG
jgi:sugar (pentulose or hexulose) kinase